MNVAERISSKMDSAYVVESADHVSMSVKDLDAVGLKKGWKASYKEGVPTEKDG